MVNFVELAHRGARVGRGLGVKSDLACCVFVASSNPPNFMEKKLALGERILPVFPPQAM